MAKKILAVVLAVMMAVSAMAVTAFADVEIPLYTQEYDANGLYNNHYDWVNTNIASFSVSFNIPVYALYGYMTSDYYMEFTLPNKGWLTDLRGNINWSIIVNGAEYTLAAGDGTSTDSILNRVYFGMGAHNYTEVGSGENKIVYWTTVPQSMSYGDLTSVRLVANVTLNNSDQWSGWKINTGAINNNNFFVKFFNAKDETEVPYSVSFMKDWGATVSEGKADVVYGTFKFATAEWDTTWLPSNWTAAQNAKANLISFDHTLANRSTLQNATDGATLKVETVWPLVGQATYTLWAKKPSSGMETNWWQYSSGRTYVDRYLLDGESSTLEFKVPYSVLWDANYGVMVEQFVIFENITLYNSHIMSSYLRFDANWGSGNIDLGAYSNQNLGKLKWAWDNKVQYETAANTFKQVRYANGGITSEPNLGTIPGGTTQVPETKTVEVKDENGNVVKDANGNPVTYEELVYEEKEVVKTRDDGTLIEKRDENGNVVRDKDGNIVYETEIVKNVKMKDVTTDDEVLANVNYAGAYNGWGDETNLGNKMPTDASKITLVVATAEEENKEVEKPEEGTNQDEEGEDVNETPVVDVEPEPAETTPAPAPADANPGTGVALAVVPMLVAAAAAVVSKKH